MSSKHAKYDKVKNGLKKRSEEKVNSSDLHLPPPPPSLTNTDQINENSQSKETLKKRRDSLKDGSIDMTVVSGYIDHGKDQISPDKINISSKIANIEVHVD